ncbi:Sodium/hydrogen exchanger family-domain-containing protein [Gorgonomyces haynaldii]|nr:Sodium/hydrogen exchanger family-domain-containing protein [Gorgonomyces haynaldii]
MILVLILQILGQTPKWTLDSVNLDKIINQRQHLDDLLDMRLENLRQKNQQGNFTAMIERIEQRQSRLDLLEDVLSHSLHLFTQILTAKDIETLDQSMDKESQLIIDQFQQLVLKAKNDKIATGENKKMEEKQKQKDKEDVEPIQKIVDGVMKDVAEKADTLETSLKDDKFKQGQKNEGTTIETVIKVKDKEQKNTTQPVLVDSENNQYVLSKPGDITKYVEDSKLLNDFLLMFLFIFISSFLAHFLRLPSFFGYLCAGILLGPGGYIANEIQVETISKGLGVILIMFFLGLEFNLTKLYKVLGVSFFGSLVLLIITIGSFILLGQQYNRSFQEMTAIGSCIFLSSTAVVLHFLNPQDIEKSFGRTIVGILVTQDVLLGFLLVMMPALAQSSETALATAFDLLSGLGLFLLTCVFIRFPCLAILKWLTQDPKRSVLLLLGSVAYCLMIVQIGAYFKQSMELACFVAGALVAPRTQIVESIVHTVTPLKEVFGALFFASLGLHIYPTFLLNEGLLLLSLTFAVIIFKAGLCVLVMFGMFKHTLPNAILVGVGLAQISEFTFVLASSAKSSNIIGREAFYLLIGVTSLSMLLSPLFWSLVSPLTRVQQKRESVDEMLLSFNEKSV